MAATESWAEHGFPHLEHLTPSEVQCKAKTTKSINLKRQRHFRGSHATNLCISIKLFEKTAGMTTSQLNILTIVGGPYTAYSFFSARLPVLGTAGGTRGFVKISPNVRTAVQPGKSGVDHMMTQTLTGKRIAILATNGVDENELMVPQQALADAGADVWVIGLRPGTIQSVRNHKSGEKIPVSAPVDEVAQTQFSALLLPGGLDSSDALRMNAGAVSFVRSFFNTHKPVAAMCDGPGILLEAGVVQDRTLTSLPSLRLDLANAGARWVDREVAVDQELVTSQNPTELAAFCRRIVAVFGQDWPGFDIDSALANPKQFFQTPKEVAELPDTDDAAKLAVLSRWESDARALSAAEDEGMGGGEESDLRAVRKAVHIVEPPTAVDTGNPTRSGG